MIGILIIHGIGSQGPGFADDFINRLVPKLTRPAICKPVVWADILPGSSGEVWSDLSWRGLRKIFAEVAFDPIAYREPYIYEQVHERIGRGLAELRDRGATTFAILAHSWGTVVASDYIWDNLTHPALLITFGSPLLRYLKPVPDPVPIKVDRWINVYCPADVIAYPIGQVNEEFSKAVIDHRLRVGWLPTSHTKYWKDKRFIGEVAARINEIVSIPRATG